MAKEPAAKKGVSLNPRVARSQCEVMNFENSRGCNSFWLVVSTHLKNISQNGNLPQVGVNIKNV